MVKRFGARKRWAMVGLAAALALCLLAGGCWDYSEIDQRAFAIMIGFDKTPEGKYQASAEIAVTRFLRGASGGAGGGGGGATKPPFRIVTAVGDTPQQAIEGIRSALFRDLDLGHVKVVVFGEDAAGDGLKQFDWVGRSFRVPNTAFLAVAHGRAEDSVKADTPAEELPGLFLYHAFSRKYNRSPDIIPVFLWEGLVKLYQETYQDV
ncbi:MAG TPA: hypothetical protein VGL40_04130, partial [Bacillota bacterium]